MRKTAQQAPLTAGRRCGRCRRRGTPGIHKHVRAVPLRFQKLKLPHLRVENFTAVTALLRLRIDHFRAVRAFDCRHRWGLLHCVLHVIASCNLAFNLWSYITWFYSSASDCCCTWKCKSSLAGISGDCVLSAKFLRTIWL